jgi:ATP-dependent DNA helicase DinG
MDAVATNPTPATDPTTAKDTASASALPTLWEFFAPGGVLARAHGSYEFRRGQLEMAQAVERALEEKRHLIVEAGTGTGKTLAYLLPALRTGRRVIVSTGTKNLQEQIFFKDIPFLESLVGPLKVCYMKGRANYLCRKKLYALRDQPVLSGLDEVSQYNEIAEWEQTTETGDRAELGSLPELSVLWNKIDARSETCLGQSCPDWERCFITGMRRKALESDILIVNHHLFFADQSIKAMAGGAPDAGVLPEAGAVIFDEAHELEDVASSYFGIGLSNVRVEELARDTESLLKAAKSLNAGILAAAGMLRERSRMFFGALPMPAYGGSGEGRMPFDTRAEFLEERGDLYSGVQAAIVRLKGELDRLDEIPEADGLANRAHEVGQHLKLLMESQDKNTVFWLERRRAGGVRAAGQHAQPQHNVFLQATPIDVSQILEQTVFEQIPSVILTSATLAVQGGFSHLRGRLGVNNARELVVPSHFNYERQAMLYLPPGMPEPRDRSFLTEGIVRIKRLLDITEGRAFLLFTSYAAMREAHDALAQQTGWPLLLQGSRSKKALIEEFRSTPNAVLLATNSFWQGVDVQGDQLSLVVVDKLPFAVPNDPIVAARTRAINDEGRNAFMEYQVPEAVIALKQGFGRLIRSLQDRGVLCLLDPRVRTARYGKTFLESLPPYRMTQDIGEVESFFCTASVGRTSVGTDPDGNQADS